MEVERGEERVDVTLFGDDDSVLAAWVQDDEAGEQVELCRSHDGEIALAVVDDMITAVRLADGLFAGRVRAGRGIEMSLPLDGRWTLEFAGELTVDGGHTGYQGGSIGFVWTDSESRPDP